MPTTWKLINLALALVFIALPAFAEVQCLKDNPSQAKLNLPIWVWQNKDVPQKGVIVAVHGLTFYAAAFDNLARHLADKGYTFYAADLRGFGRWKIEAAKFNGDDLVHFSQSQEDLATLLKLVRSENPNSKIYCLGESLGANYALWVASTYPSLIDGVIAGSPCIKCCVHVRLRWPADFLQGLLHPKTRLNLEPYINPYLSHDKVVTVDCLKDSKICRSLSPVDLVKTRITNRRTIEHVSEIPSDMPILIIAGRKDRVFKTSSLIEFIPQIGSKKITMNVLENKGHLLLEHQVVLPEVSSMIDEWLDKQTKKTETVVSMP